MERHYLTTDREVRRAVERARAAREVAIDTETYALDRFLHLPRPWHKPALVPHMNQIRLVQLATRDAAYIVDLRHGVDLEPLVALVLDPEVKKIGHNLKFENTLFLYHWQDAQGRPVYIENCFDTMLAARLFHRVVRKLPGSDDYPSGHTPEDHKESLAALCARYLSLGVSKHEQASDWGRAELTDEQIDYAFRDVEVLFPLYDVLADRIRRFGFDRVARIEFAAIPAFAQMEVAGWAVDREQIAEIRDAVDRRRAELDRRLADQFPANQRGLWDDPGINVDSAAELRRAFREHFDIHIDDTNKRALLQWLDPSDEFLAFQLATAAGELNAWARPNDIPRREMRRILRANELWTGQFAARHDRLRDAILTVLDYKALKPHATTAEEILTHMNPVSGRVHPDLWQIGQDQHRSSARSPGIMKIPRPDRFGPGAKGVFHFPASFRSSFVPADGSVFSIADYSGNQLRIVADMSRDPVMVRAFNEGRDLHQVTAAEIMGVSFDEARPWRSAAKGWNFAFAFLVGTNTFMLQKLERTREYSSFDECDGQRRAWRETFAGVTRWQRATVERTTREARTTPTREGRQIYFHPENCRLGQIYNEAVNFPVSATEVDGGRLALARIFRRLHRDHPRARIVGFIYDEIIIECPSAEADSVRQLHEELMRDSMQRQLRAVPAEAEAATCSSWADKS